MTSNHAIKGSKRYRYYTTREDSDDEPAWRVSAHDLETIVRDQPRALLTDRNRVARIIAQIDPRKVEPTIANAAKLAAMDRIRGMAITRIELRKDHLIIQINQPMLLRICGLDASADDQRSITLSAAITTVRRGHAVDHSR
jgi:hypothetical protein